MSFFGNPNDLKLLQNLISPNEAGSDSEDDSSKPPPTADQPIPANQREPKIPAEKGPNPYAKADAAAQPKTFEEWTTSEEADAALVDSRPQPEYSISYKQNVKAEDVFLQLGNRTAATASCEDMIVDVAMPEETVGVDSMELSVLRQEVLLATPRYRARIPLPHAVNPDRSNASWDADRKTLKLVLRMVREMDFVNF